MNVHRPEPKVWRTQTNVCNPGEGKGPGKGNYLAHCSYNSTRFSSDTITMEEKLYVPSKMENARDKHAAGT